MTIGQFAQLSGLTAKALRFYDEKGLLTPYEVDRSSAYRRYAPAQLRRAGTIKALRGMGMSLSQVGEVLDSPDRAAELLAAFRDEVAAQHAAQNRAIASGCALLEAYDQAGAVQTRRAGVQAWVGAVVEVDLETADPEDAGPYDAVFAQLWTALHAVGNPPSGAFWTTIRSDEDPKTGRLLLCWPVTEPVAAGFAVDGLTLESGVLPERTEVYARMAVGEPQFGEGVPEDAMPLPAVVALMEHVDEVHHLDWDDDVAEIRQVGVLGADQLPVAIDLTVDVPDR